MKRIFVALIVLVSSPLIADRPTCAATHLQALHDHQVGRLLPNTRH